MKRNFFIFVSMFFILLSLFILPSESKSALSESIEWNISAQCQPHSRITGPRALRVHFFYTPQRGSEPLYSATMIVEGDYTEQYTAIKNQISFPIEGYISSIFDGPPITGEFFCQESGRAKRLNLAYEHYGKFKIYLSRDGDFTKDELNSFADVLPSNYVDVLPTGEFLNIYPAGKGVLDHYWLQMSIPVKAAMLGSSLVRYTFF